MFRQAFRLDEFFLDNASINLSGSLKPFTHKPYGLFGGLETHPTTAYRSIIKNQPFCRKAKHKTAHCSLLTAHYSLLTAHCSLNETCPNANKLFFICHN